MLKKIIPILLILVLFVPLYFALAVADTFESYTDGQIITDHTYYTTGTFPNNGSSDVDNPSAIWQTDSGGIYADDDSTGNTWGFSGNPTTWGNRYHFRANTQASAIDQVVEFDYKSAAFGESGYAVESGDATDVWLRYQTQYWLYVVQFDRVNNCLVAKRKVPADSGWTGPGNPTNDANKGVYYTLKTDSAQPTFGAGYYCITWGGLGLSNLAHNGTSAGGTQYHFKATITTVAAGVGTCSGYASSCAQIQLFRGGNLVASWTDKNDGDSPYTTNTFQQDWDAGYFNGVTGFNSSWQYPITTTGTSGLRADNIKVWIDNFSFTENGAASPTVSGVPTSVSAVGGNARIDLTWAAPTDNGGSAITGYKVYRDTTTNPTTLLTTLGNVLSYADTTTSNGTTYYYRVKAVNAVGDSSFSSNTSATPQAPPALPSVPLSLDAVSGDSLIRLTWAAPASDGNSTITGYKIYRDTTTNPTTLLTTVGNVLLYTDSTATNDVFYYYRVKATNAIGDSNFSDQDFAAPSQPGETATTSISCIGSCTFIGNVTFQ